MFRRGAVVTGQVCVSLCKTLFSKVAVRGHLPSSSLGESQLPLFLPTHVSCGHWGGFAVCVVSVHLSGGTHPFMGLVASRP